MVGSKGPGSVKGYRKLAQQLREMHLSTWADTLERQTRIVTGD